jgi:hypothetical protein
MQNISKTTYQTLSGYGGVILSSQDIQEGENGRLTVPGQLR